MMRVGSCKNWSCCVVVSYVTESLVIPRTSGSAEGCNRARGSLVAAGLVRRLHRYEIGCEVLDPSLEPVLLKQAGFSPRSAQL